MFKDKTTQDMTIGNPMKLILAFSIPLIIGNIFQQLYTIVDTMVVGQALGVKALAALGSIDTINWVVTGFILGITQGFGILIAQKFGEGDRSNLNIIVTNSVVMSIIMAIILLVLVQLAIIPGLTLLRVPEEIVPYSVLYLRILISGIPIVVIYNMEAVILRSLGDSKSPLVAMTIATFTNIVLDILFVVAFKWGIKGAAIATLISQFLSAVFCFVRVKKIDILDIGKDGFRIDRKWAFSMMKMGLPLATQNVIISFGGMILQSVIDGFGIFVIAGSTATNKLYGILESAALAYGYAMTTYVGQNYGARKPDRIRKGVTTANVISVFSCVIIACITIGFGKYFLKLFISGNPEEVESTLYYAYAFLCDLSLFLPTLYLIHVLRSVLQGLGHTVVTMYSGFVELIIRIVAALTLPLIFGARILFGVHILAWIGSDILLIIAYYYYMRKLEGQIIENGI